MSPQQILYALPGNDELYNAMLSAGGFDGGLLEVSRFPDGESYLRFETNPEGKHIALFASLNDPDAKLISLLLAARTARDLGAASVGLIAPYMPYFRQDIAFRPGESVSARHIGAILSDNFSWVVTVDPHLHRLAQMADVFSIPASVASSTNAMAAWIIKNTECPIICGPDSESEQWVSKIAAACGAPYLVFQKTRYDAKSVEVAVAPDLDISGYTPVIIDDIISTGGTVMSLAKELARLGSQPAICCVVHALFSSDVEDRILGARVDRVITTNSISHRTNAVDISEALAESTKATFSTIANMGTNIAK